MKQEQVDRRKQAMEQRLEMIQERRKTAESRGMEPERVERLFGRQEQSTLDLIDRFKKIAEDNGLVW